MRASNSQLLKTLKANYFKTINAKDQGHSGTYNKVQDRVNMLEFELERNRDTIIKLRSEIVLKDKEISLLKVNKNKKHEEYNKTMKIIEEILKQCDQSTTTGFTAIENSVLNMDSINNNENNTSNKSNSHSCKNKNKKSLTHLPQIGNMLHITNKQKKNNERYGIYFFIKKPYNEFKRRIS